MCLWMLTFDWLAGAPRPTPSFGSVPLPSGVGSITELPSHRHIAYGGCSCRASSVRTGKQKMQSQACEPCAKRKVRCDRSEPCSNCKRRKQDRCNYPELSPSDRIKKLEALVRTLGGNPDDDAVLNSRLDSSRAFSPPTPVLWSLHESQGQASASDSRSKDPVILEEDGQQYYLES